MVTRAHGFAGYRDWRLPEMSRFKFLWHTDPTSRELRTRDHRNEVTVQSSRHGSSKMKQAVPTDARDFGAKPPRSASAVYPWQWVVVVFFTWERRSDSALPLCVAEDRAAVCVSPRPHAAVPPRKNIRWCSLRVPRARAGPRGDTPLLVNFQF